MAAAAVVGSILALGTSGVAAADTPASGPIHGGGSYKISNAKDPENLAFPAKISITLDGKDILMYCVNYRHRTGEVYEETSWDAGNFGPDANLGKIVWILGHSYPTVGFDALLSAAGATRPAGLEDDHLLGLVYSATQAAIWRYSDPNLFALGPYVSAPLMPPAEWYPIIEKIYQYLVDNAKELPEPGAALAIDPATGTGAVGTRIGPFTVKFGGVGKIALSATGGKLVDKDGNPVDSLSGGEKFWVTSDTPGTVSIKATGSGQIPIGRVFRAVENPQFQKLILAAVAGKPLAAEATATVTPPPPALPKTGSSTLPVVVAGLVLVAGGALLVVLIRRRRIRFTA